MFTLSKRIQENVDHATARHIPMLQEDTMSHEDAEASTEYLIIYSSPAAGPDAVAPSPAGFLKPQGYGPILEWLIIRSQSSAPAPASAAAKHKSPSTGSQGTGAKAPSKAHPLWNRITNTEPMSGFSASMQAWNLPSPATYPLQSLLVHCPVSSAVQPCYLHGSSLEAPSLVPLLPNAGKVLPSQLSAA